MVEYEINGTLEGQSVRVSSIVLKYVDEFAEVAKNIAPGYSGLEAVRTVGEHSACTVVQHGAILGRVLSVSIFLRDTRNGSVVADHPDLLAILRERAEEIDNAVRAKVESLRGVAKDVRGACEAGLLIIADNEARQQIRDRIEQLRGGVSEDFRRHSEQHDELWRRLRKAGEATDKRIAEIWQALEKLRVKRPAPQETEDEEE